MGGNKIDKLKVMIRVTQRRGAKLVRCVTKLSLLLHSTSNVGFMCFGGGGCLQCDNVVFALEGKLPNAEYEYSTYKSRL